MKGDYYVKKIFALVLAVVFILALFAACGTNTPNNTAAPDTPTAAPVNPGTPDAPAAPGTPDAPATSDAPYAVDEVGIAMEPYNWPMPLTEDSEEVLSCWWCTYSPQYIPADKTYAETDLPVEVKRITGVNVEYINVPSTSRQDNYAVLLASDSLCDMMFFGDRYYPGTPLQMIEDGYFANIYDYKDCMPNYLYQAKYAHPEDKDTYESVFYTDTVVPVCHVLWADHVITDTGYCVRQDFLDKVGMKAEDLKTWDDFTEAMKAVKTAVETVEFPLWIAQMIETNNYWYFHSFENVSILAGLPPVYIRDGQLVMGSTSEGDKQFAQQFNMYQREKLLNPDWQSYFYSMVFMPHTLNNEIFWQGLGSTAITDANNQCTDPDCNWVPVGKPLVTEGQVIHAGTIRSRATTGNCCFAAKNTNLELCMKWVDYRYSPEGWELFAYGPEGKIVEKDANGVRHNTEWALSNPDGMDLTGLVSIYTSSRMVEPGLTAYDVQLLNPAGEPALAAIDFWTNFDKEHFDKAGCLPIGVRLDTDQSEELNKYSNDISTFISENYGAFILGDKSFDEWDSYIDTLNMLGLQNILDVYQEAYDAYLNK